jgi:hypothetical protein
MLVSTIKESASGNGLALCPEGAFKAADISRHANFASLDGYPALHEGHHENTLHLRKVSLALRVNGLISFDISLQKSDNPKTCDVSEP